MRTKILTVLSLAAALLPCGCVSETPQQMIATGVYAAGYATANDALKHDPAILAQLQDVAAKLPQLNSGKLSASDMGTLAGELQNVEAQTTLLKGLFPGDSNALDNANAFISGVIQSNAALNGGKAPTVDQVVATTGLTDFANGLTDGAAYEQGKAAVPKA